jgi:enediyne biosynthesis protein E4
MLSTSLRSYQRLGIALATFLLVLPALPAMASDVHFTDIAASAGITYERVPSPRIANRDAVVAQSPIPSGEFGMIRATQSPQKGRGNPGIVIFDYDNDGDNDIYVTNGPGANNSLYANQLTETGAVTFVDVGGAAGVGAFNQDSSGACAGDIDNDDDMDLYVLGTGEANILFENQGDGTFLDITTTAGVGGAGRHATGCSFGDIDNDGLLDVVVANTYDSWDHRIPVFTVGPTYEGMEHNYLFHNQGGNIFADVSATSGIENVSNMPGGAFTWAIAMVDIDQDGDIDIVSADNQGGASQDPSQDRGWNRIFQNDGSGNFTDVTVAAGLDFVGGWMGLDFGDLNCDGNMDFFSTNLGYLGLGQPSQWWLGNGDGTFTNPGQGSLVQNPFGWGTSMLDYDNDGDSDIVYHGGVDLLSLIIQDNPGVLLRNEGLCTANFDWDADAFSVDHRSRTVHAVAVGDLNGDGFEDIVSASNFNTEEKDFRLFAGLFFPPFGSPFDDVSGVEVAFTSAINPGFQTYVDPILVAGNLVVEINSADNGNGWAQITPRGSKGTLANGQVNRDGIGAVLTFTPNNSVTSMRPIVGGSSYSSQDDLAANFGLGSAKRGTVDILWPGGTRNRLYNVFDGEKLTFPEIPCSYEDPDLVPYLQCLISSLQDLSDADVISSPMKARLLSSGIRAWAAHRN